MLRDIPKRNSPSLELPAGRIAQRMSIGRGSVADALATQNFWISLSVCPVQQWLPALDRTQRSLNSLILANLTTSARRTRQRSRVVGHFEQQERLTLTDSF